MNGRPDVAAATRERVQDAVRELGFSTNRIARSLVGGRTFLVGITLPLVEAEYFSRIVAGAVDELYDHDLQVVLAPTLHLRDRSATLLARLAGGMTDGALLILPEESREALRRLTRTGYPFVVIDPSNHSMRVCRRSPRRMRSVDAPRPSICSRSDTGASGPLPASPSGSPASSV
jgi:Transcriptional regulators